MNTFQKIVLTLWLTVSVVYGIYLYNQKMAYCFSDWLPTGLNQAQATDLCFNSFLHSFAIVFAPLTIAAFVLYKLWAKRG